MKRKLQYVLLGTAEVEEMFSISYTIAEKLKNLTCSRLTMERLGHSQGALAGIRA